LRVVPVLVEGTEPLDVGELPDDIAKLARCQYVRVRHHSLDTDLAYLVDELLRVAPGLARPVTALRETVFRLTATDCQLEIVPGTIRRVRNADIWVNSENTEMHMARHNEFSISGIIRYWGAVRDDAGRIVSDVVADELDDRVRTVRPVAPGAAVVTGAGALTASHNVQRIIHVASVHGEPGAGYRQIRNVGVCVTNALHHAERLADDLPNRTVLFPLLGTGVAGADVAATASAMVTAAVDHLVQYPDTGLRRLCFLAYNDREHRALENAFGSVIAETFGQPPGTQA